MRIANRTVMVALLAGVVGVSGAKRASANMTQGDTKFEELSALVTRKMAEHRVSGVAFGIVKNGQVSVRGFGVTNMQDPQPITADTVFPIASISKTVVATAIMRLVEQGK